MRERSDRGTLLTNDKRPSERVNISVMSLPSPNFSVCSTMASVFTCMLLGALRLHVAQPAEDIVEVGYHHEQDKDAETHVLCAYHELFGRLAAGNHLVE